MNQAHPTPSSPLNALRDQVHQLACDQGWHDADQPEDQYLATFIANTHAELSELWEAHRADQLHAPCDKPTNLTCLEEEMADIIIRTLDACGRLHIDIDTAVQRKHTYNQKRPHRHGNKKA
jgi:NTP pyrophosphatase (non-canonical NTP hydrolase)